jgi:hypothetical protein
MAVKMIRARQNVSGEGNNHKNEANQYYGYEREVSNMWISRRTASAIANDDEFSANFGHVARAGRGQG